MGLVFRPVENNATKVNELHSKNNDFECSKLLFRHIMLIKKNKVAGELDRCES